MAYKILIVDDSAVTRAVLKKTIMMIGLTIEEVHQAGNGQDALTKLQEFDADLVFADLNMPKMNGLEMSAKILADEKTKNIPIVVISTEASETRIEQLKAKGISGYIHKPFTPEQIRDVLLDVLEECPT